MAAVFLLMGNIKSRFSRRAVALFWLLIVSIVIGILIYSEQIAILYVLATLALVALLLVVVFADLENVSRENIDGFASEE